MMHSAFGVEHGEEVVKANFTIPKMPKPGGGMLKPLKTGVQRAGVKVQGLSKPAGRQAGRQYSQNRMSTGNAFQRMGRGAKGVGQSMQNNPGAYLAGGAGAGAGAAGVASFGGQRKKSYYGN